VTAEFLSDPRHHLVAAIDHGAVVGFASAVHYVHPDKRSPEMWINEVGVATTHRGRGVAKAILQRLLDVAREDGCVEAWLLTDRTNEAALRLYRFERWN
jgi:ribosomal protein S18 acetylase RimI-like enzyme